MDKTEAALHVFAVLTGKYDVLQHARSEWSEDMVTRDDKSLLCSRSKW